MKPLPRIGLIVAAALVPVASIFGATVTGNVKGPDGAPMKGAFVQAQNAATKVTVSVLSNNDGRYRIEKLPAGQYQLQVKAAGFKAEPRSGVSLTADQSASYEFALQKGAVRWNELSSYQGEQLFPEGKGKSLLTGRCFACHGFETRMASVKRDEEGWRDRVDYMRQSMHFFLDGVGGNFTDQNAADVAAYMNSLFGENSVLPKSPAEMPAYKQLAHAPFSDEAMKIVYVEYDLPGPSRMPWSAAPDKSGNLWIPYYGNANKIARLDPKTAQVQEFPVPNAGTAAVHSAVPAADGSVWLTEQGSNKIGRWDPETQKITEYQDAYVPGKEGIVAGGSKHTVRIDQQGRAWATGGPLSVFDAKTGKFTEIAEVPTAYGLVIDKDGNCWFAEFAKDGKIGKVDGKTLKVTKWTPPTPDPRPRRIQIDTDGMVWFAEFAAGKIARFDPRTEAFKEFSLPGAEPTPYALGIDKDHRVWFSSEHMDYVGRLDPASGQVTEYPFPHSENTMREFFPDTQGRIWFATPANNKVGYFYLAGGEERASR